MLSFTAYTVSGSSSVVKGLRLAPHRLEMIPSGCKGLHQLSAQMLRLVLTR